MTLRRQVQFWLISLAVFCAFLYVFSGVLLPFVAGMAVAYLLDPVCDRLESLGMGRMWATLTILLAFIFILVLFFILLLPVLGNLRLALQHADQDANTIRQGVQMIWQQCEDFLRGQGVEAIETVGKPFDPAYHEALSTAPATEETPDNTVVAEVRPGYLRNGQLLHAAQVIVARAASPAAVDDAADAAEPPAPDEPASA